MNFLKQTKRFACCVYQNSANVCSNPKSPIEELLVTQYNKIFNKFIGYMVRKDFMRIEKFYPLKSMFEHLWGEGTYLELKHCSDIKIWKKYATNTLKASLIAINVSVEIKDDEWQKETEEIIKDGIHRIMSVECVSFDDLFSRICATYIRLSFHQIGFVPQRPLNLKRATLRRTTWQLNMIRTVQYVQSSEQREYQEKYRIHKALRNRIPDKLL